MTAKERAVALIPMSVKVFEDEEIAALRAAIANAIEAAVKEAVESFVAERGDFLQRHQALRSDHLLLQRDIKELLAIASELAAKHLRGAKACTACGSAAYMGTLQHNEGCCVKRLEAFQ